jgi:hypothetical protein
MSVAGGISDDSTNGDTFITIDNYVLCYKVSSGVVP